MGLVFDGKNIENGFRNNGAILPLHVETKPDYSFPEKDYQSVHVPGKNGDVLVDLGTYKNVTRTYYISCGTDGAFDYKGIARQITSWLAGSSGYRILTDTYEPDIFMYACFRSAGVVNRITDNGARIQITFDCKPQKYLRTEYPEDNQLPSASQHTPGSSIGTNIYTSNASTPITFLNLSIDSSNIVDRPYIAKPLIKIRFLTPFTDQGYLSFVSGSIETRIKFHSNSSDISNQFIYVDCESEEVYGPNFENWNRRVELMDNRWPCFYPGTNYVYRNRLQGYSQSSSNWSGIIYTRYWTL